MEKSTLQVNLFDGTRAPFRRPVDLLITIVDGNQRQQFREYWRGDAFTFALPFFDNLGDRYAVTVFAAGYRQVGFTPVVLSATQVRTLDLMLVPERPGFNFAEATWAAVDGAYPFLGADTDAATAQARYEGLVERQGAVVACFLNLVEAMGQIQLRRGTPLDYFKQMRWDRAPQRDRFFAYCDAALVDQVRQAAAAGVFAVDAASAILHPGATASWKQVQFGEANVQLTFHEGAGDRKTIGGVECVTVEPDMDYYKDPAAHTIVEVIPNALTHTLTDPVEVYVLRWMAGRHAGVAEFAPKYRVV